MYNAFLKLGFYKLRVSLYNIKYIQGGVMVHAVGDTLSVETFGAQRNVVRFHYLGNILGVERTTKGGQYVVITLE
jgi:hypothetical protein